MELGYLKEVLGCWSAREIQKAASLPETIESGWSARESLPRGGTVPKGSGSALRVDV